MQYSVYDSDIKITSPEMAMAGSSGKRKSGNQCGLPVVSSDKFQDIAFNPAGYIGDIGALKR